MYAMCDFEVATTIVVYTKNNMNYVRQTQLDMLYDEKQYIIVYCTRSWRVGTK